MTVHVPYIVMEVVDGRTLREHLTATGPMGAVEAGRIVEDVLAALDYSPVSYTHLDVYKRQDR